MHTHEYWIAKGKIIERPKKDCGADVPERTLLFNHELVRIICSADGTTIKWVMFGANWASLYFAKELISTFIGPFTLEFFNAGWFTEHFETADDAKIRIDQLIIKSDVRFSTRTFTRAFNPVEQKFSAGLKDIWSAGEVEESKAVHCAIDADREHTHVEHIGTNSALAKVWGVSSVSYPCLSGHSYDKVVSKSYYEVIKTGRPHYDHVLAAMVNPTGEVKWYGYHRLIFARRKTLGLMPQVSVACEIAEVDIPLL
jgi:hypothetical protein